MKPFIWCIHIYILKNDYIFIYVYIYIYNISMYLHVCKIVCVSLHQQYILAHINILYNKLVIIYDNKHTITTIYICFQ